MSEKSPKNIKNTCKTNIYKFRANSKKAQQVNPSPFKSAQVPWTYFDIVVVILHARQIPVLCLCLDVSVRRRRSMNMYNVGPRGRCEPSPVTVVQCRIQVTRTEMPCVRNEEYHFWSHLATHLSTRILIWADQEQSCDPMKPNSVAGSSGAYANLVNLEVRWEEPYRKDSQGGSYRKDWKVW